MKAIRFCIVVGAISVVLTAASADDFAGIRADFEKTLPIETLDRLIEPSGLVFRVLPRAPSKVYRDRVSGVVLLASTKAVGTGVLVSNQGDIVTNDHVVQAAHRSQGQEWVAVWFKPSDNARPGKANFLLGKVLRRDPQRDLAHIRLVEAVPPTAAFVPMARTPPDIGREVFTIGHPKTYLWSFGQGVVSKIHPDYRWEYADGVTRVATAIQTQAPVNPGNSGGPLLDERGRIVGIVVGSATEVVGIYFAVSVQHVHELLTR